MLQVSRMADYAVVLTTYIAKNTGKLHTAPSVAEETNLGEATVSKLLKLLTKHNVLASTRGAKGGYSLAQKPAEITLYNIVEAVDGPLALVWCAKENNPKIQKCSVRGLCTAECHWKSINTTIATAMNSVSVADLMASPTPQDA